ncbi:N-acetylglucosamine-6-phosphate deacetylase-like isoform X2 [Limulus polyphemus]|uniref:N-acetylglucosamine-6-phosphate deacetylase-like isoform X2 n=1 Tax=Limulus polyphemus TaxID=6850 RepID=A0ABM1BTB0_LIMPO|nr:N-acetylglucosamine-6-phosphate deacetylase-like isoform X2 [Limulus polyphemus]
MGLEAGTHYIGEQAVEIEGHRAIIAGTSTLCGSIATMDMCVRYFKNATGCNKVEALECATLHPAQVLGITSLKGTLDFGSDADFILLDQDLRVHATFISGECVWEDNNPETHCLYKKVLY